MLLALPALARVGYKVERSRLPPVRRGAGRAAATRAAITGCPTSPCWRSGADASVSAGQIAQARKIMGPKRKLGLGDASRDWAAVNRSDAEVIRNAGQRDPVHIKVLDWVHYSAGHSSWFQPDGLHLDLHAARRHSRGS